MFRLRFPADIWLLRLVPGRQPAAHPGCSIHSRNGNIRETRTCLVAVVSRQSWFPPPARGRRSGSTGSAPGTARQLYLSFRTGPSGPHFQRRVRQLRRSLRLKTSLPHFVVLPIGSVVESVARALQFAAACLSWSVRIVVLVPGVAAADHDLVGRRRPRAERPQSRLSQPPSN